MPRLAILLSLLVSMTATACSTLTGGPLVRPGEPTGVLEVINRSGYSLTAVVISDCDALSYGMNRLPSGTVINPGQSYRFVVSAGCWDIGAGLAYRDAYQRVQVRPRQHFRWTVEG